VAHRDSHFAADVLKAGPRGIEGPWNIAAGRDRWGERRMEARRDIAAGLDRRSNMVLRGERRGKRQRSGKKRELRKIHSSVSPRRLMHARTGTCNPLFPLLSQDSSRK